MDVPIRGKVTCSPYGVHYDESVSAGQTVCARGENLLTLRADAYKNGNDAEGCGPYIASQGGQAVFYFSVVHDDSQNNNCKVVATDEPDCDPSRQSFFKTLAGIEEVDGYNFGQNSTNPLTNIVDYIDPKFENCFEKTYRYALMFNLYSVSHHTILIVIIYPGASTNTFTELISQI